jgi:hypothetical protein
MSRACLAPRCVPIDLLCLREQVAAIVCSSSWLEVCWEAVCCGGDAAVRAPEAFLLRHAIYPPGGASRRRGMRRCKSCGGRWYPPQYVGGSAGICADCLVGRDVPLTDEGSHVSTTSSPTAAAMQRMDQMRVRLIEARLPSEGEGALRREIAAFERTGRLAHALVYHI